MHHHELHRDLGALALPVHVDAPRIDGIRLLRPGDQLLDRLVIVRAEFPALRRRSDQHVIVAQSQAQQRLAHGEQIVAGRRVVLLGAEDQAHLPGRIHHAGSRDAGRHFDHIFEDGLARFILKLGFLRGPQRRHQQGGHKDKAGQPRELRARRFPAGQADHERAKCRCPARRTRRRAAPAPRCRCRDPKSTTSPLRMPCAREGPEQRRGRAAREIAETRVVDIGQVFGVASHQSYRRLIHPSGRHRKIW